MATTVFTGWRKVTPGRCSDCGEKDGWDCDGRGTVFCDCQVCAQCGEFDEGAIRDGWEFSFPLEG